MGAERTNETPRAAHKSKTKALAYAADAAQKNTASSDETSRVVRAHGVAARGDARKARKARTSSFALAYLGLGGALAVLAGLAGESIFQVVLRSVPETLQQGQRRGSVLDEDVTRRRVLAPEQGSEALK